MRFENRGFSKPVNERRLVKKGSRSIRFVSLSCSQVGNGLRTVPKGEPETVDLSVVAEKWAAVWIWFDFI
jgi:hypothetical protein